MQLQFMFARMATSWIEPFRPEDYDQVKALWTESAGVRLGPGDSPLEVKRFLERNPGLSHVIWNSERTEIIGVVMCGHDGRRGFIYHLAVSKARQGERLGRALVERALQGLKVEGIARCQVFVLAENERARSFWKHMRGALRSDLVVYSLES